jgi:hypothetical protein
MVSTGKDRKPVQNPRERFSSACPARAWGTFCRQILMGLVMGGGVAGYVALSALQEINCDHPGVPRCACGLRVPPLATILSSLQDLGSRFHGERTKLRSTNTAMVIRDKH